MLQKSVDDLFSFVANQGFAWTPPGGGKSADWGDKPIYISQADATFIGIMALKCLPESSKGVTFHSKLYIYIHQQTQHTVWVSNLIPKQRIFSNKAMPPNLVTRS